MAKRKQLFEVDANNNITNTSINKSNNKKKLFEVKENGSIKNFDTSKEKKKKKKKSGFFQGSKYFDNGYDFGDVSKTLFWSGADLLTDVTRGFSRTVEGTTDTLGYLSADLLDFFGADDTADWLRDTSKYDVTGKLFKGSDYLESRSVFGNYSDTVFEGVGNVGGMAVMNTVMPGSGVTSTAFSSFSSAYGNSMSEALRNGADLSTARKTAFINGTAEAISEQFFDALPGMKTENWGGKLIGKIGSGVEKYFGTNTGKLAMKILNASGEGFEEIISNMLTSAGNDIMHKFDKNFTYGMEGQTGNILEDVKRAATSKESWSAFLSASLTSALTNGGNQFISNTQKNKLIKSYAQENNMTVSQVKQMFNQSVQDKTQSQMQKQPNMDLGQRVDIENQAKAQTMSELKRGTFVAPGTETDAYKYSQSENQKVNEMNQSMVDAGGNNTQANRELTATAKRLIEDLGFNIKFTNSQQLQEQGVNVEGRNINGFVKDGTMYLNLDSNELSNFTIGHETKHFFEANEELNNALNQSLKEFAQEKGVWDKMLADRVELYTDKDGKLVGDPEGELLADLTGQFFTDYNFVTNLSTKNPTLFERARDFFQKLYYKATGQKEKLLIKQINDNFNKAYREYANTQPKQEGTQYSISEKEQKTYTKDSQGRELSEQQQERFKDSKVRDENGNLIPLYHGSNVIDTTVFTKDKFGNKGITFLTNDADIADTYRNKKGRRYEFYADIKNPYIIDGNGKNWNDILIGENQNTVDLYNSLTNEDKTYLTNLANQMNEMYKGNESIEGFYQRLNANNESLYDKLTNDSNIREKIYNAALNNWNDESINDLIGQRYSTDKLVKEIYDKGENDGIIFRNIVDRGANYHKPIGRRTSDVYVVFNSNQIKNVNNTNPTDSPDIRYSLSKNEDTYLDELSQQQMEYFKDTKAVDKLGYLDVVFHGTPEDFTVFDINKTNDVAFGNGLYFTTSEGNAESYSKSSENPEGKVLDGYVNIKKPASRTEKTISFEDFKNLYNELNNNPNLYDEEMEMSNIDALLSDYGNVYEENIDNILRKFYDSYDNDVTLIDNLSYMDNAKEMYKTLRDVTGVDGIIVDNPTGFDDKERYYIIFNPDQFKLKSNKTPTIDEDMRYSLSREGQNISEELDEFYTPKNKVTTRLSDLKRKEVEIPAEQENALKTSENEQKQGEKPTRREAIDRNRQLAREQLGDISNIKDKKRGFLYQINTMKRNLRDIMSKEQAQKMYDTYFKDITTNNAKIENEINSYNERIQKYNLNDAESTYTQMIGELKHNPETTLTQEDIDNFYNKNINKIDQQKCENAVTEFRNIYDELIEKINDVLTDNGYKPIEYRKGYFPHFIEEKATSKLGKLAEKLGWKVKKGQLPTDVAGITDQFKPGKAWTSFSQQRTGDATDYNALKGLDNYLRGAMDVIYHTNDIQKLRALENEIRYQYSDKGIQDKINEIYADDTLDMEEKNDAIANLTANIRESGLGNFVTEIRNYTDNLANKKSITDRGLEQTFGRDVYSIMNNINGRVSANMVGANISSAITNFIPITQAWGNISTKNLMKGMYESIKTSIKGDDFANRSTFLTNRTKQADRLYNTKLEKINKKLGIPFEAIDSFTANTIVRGKYYDNIAKGMSEQEAINNADEFAKDVMAGRSKGDQPTMFNKKNPLVKLFTAFQLEVNNQYGYMFKDIPTNLADEAKDKLVGAFIKMFLGAWLYNEISEKFTGRRAAFDPIDMAVTDIKTLTDENMDLGDKIQSIVKDTSQELPFVSGVMGGGRLPIQGAIPYSDPLEMITSTFEDIGKLDDPEKRKTAINNLKKEWSKPVYYLLMPFAGGQIKKTVEGLSMYDKDLPVAGSYTNSGKLRFEADTSPLGKVQAAVFGQYASKNAREYFDKGYTPLTEKQLNTALDADMSANEYREYTKGLKEQKTTEEKVDYIYGLPLSDSQKNVLVNSALTRKDNIDLSNYGDYGSLAEFDYANKNPEKYLTITNITDYDTFQTYKEDISAIKNSYNNTNDRKQAVFEYINSLPLNIEQKLMLQKMAGGYSIKQYRSRMHDYINSLDLTAQEKQSIDDILFK